MPTLVKICGLKTKAAMAAALDGGANFVGLVFYPPSPRSLSPEDASVLAEQARGRARVVALVVDADDRLLDSINQAVRPDLLQLHGAETLERGGAISDRLGIPIMKAINVRTAADAGKALAWRDVSERVLFDAKAPEGLKGALPGGNGLSFDWHVLDEVRDKVNFMLSGGLTADNVATAIRLTGAPAVDVSSGVESSPGVKDVELIAKFLAAAKAA
jgi:phosphoribosylanthranilate isomerase